MADDRQHIMLPDLCVFDRPVVYSIHETLSLAWSYSVWKVFGVNICILRSRVELTLSASFLFLPHMTASSQGRRHCQD